MLTILSPAKKLLNIDTPYEGTSTTPLFSDKTKQLAKIMKSKSVEEIASLMDLSKDLAELNYTRYQSFASADSYPALYLFQGDVYQGLQSKSWAPDTVAYSQSHLRILSGLYGLLHPLDCIQPYRLEMGVRLENPAGKNLYVFWQESITRTLNQELETQRNPVLINLASTEYFKAVDEKKLNYPVVTINFYEKKNGALKMIGIHAKKARGVMAKFLMEHQIDDLEQLKKFDELGYQYHEATSSEKHFDFVRG